MTGVRKRWVLLLGFLLLGIGLVLAIRFDPTARVQGWIKGEPFYHDRSATAWNRDLSAGDSPAAASAFESLVAGQAESVPMCIWILNNSQQSEARWRAADALRLIGKPARPSTAALVQGIADPNQLVRGVCIRAVGELAPEAEEAIPELIAVLPDIDAIRTLSRFGPVAAPAVPRLIELLAQTDPTVKWQAARTLGKIREPALLAVPELAKLTVADPDSQVREHAAEALGDIGPLARAGIPALVTALQDSVPRVRRDAVRALGQMGVVARDALPAVAALSNDPDADVSAAAQRAIRLIDPTLPLKK